MKYKGKYVIHFGVKIYKPYKINKKDYLNARTKNSFGKTEEYHEEIIQKFRRDAKRNFEINIEKINQIDNSKFEEYLINLSNKYHFEEIFDLNLLNNVSGLYIIVLGEYKQLYIGQSTNIFDRIKTHWRKFKPLDRLIFGSVETSVISIDSFGNMDTTNIFYLEIKEQNLRDELEYKIIKETDSELMLNRVLGGSDALSKLETHSYLYKKHFKIEWDESEENTKLFTNGLYDLNEKSIYIRKEDENN